MLVRFYIENFTSFKDRQVFSMIPGKGSLKAHHKGKKIKGVSALKAAVIYGANASGKSNLMKAIAFGKKLILNGTKAGRNIQFQNFRLDAHSINENSRIEYEIQHTGKNYAYGFVFNKNEIVEEWLFRVTKNSEEKIFTRTNTNDFDLTKLFNKNKKTKEQQFLKFIAQGTPDNQLFLTEIKTRKVAENVSDITDLLNVIDWFQNSLKVIFPLDKYNLGIRHELKDNSNLLKVFEELLAYFDTGVDGVCLEKTYRDRVVAEIPKQLIDQIEEDLVDEKSKIARVMIQSSHAIYLISVEKGSIVFHKFMTKHKVLGTKKVELFDTSDESDGTNRIIDFIPLLIDLLQGDNVFIIDEMERSLHPNLIYDLIDLFLSKSKDINSQLILASHESTLLTQKLLRKDEIWFVEKDKTGASFIL